MFEFVDQIVFQVLFLPNSASILSSAPVAATLILEILYLFFLYPSFDLVLKQSTCVSTQYSLQGWLPSLLRVSRHLKLMNLFLTSLVPHIHRRFENGVEARGTDMIGRGAYYAPRSLQRRKVEEITITQLQDQILSGSQLSSEIELVQIVQEKIIIIDQTKRNKDNIRKNHFANVYNTVVCSYALQDCIHVNQRYTEHYHCGYHSCYRSAQFE